MAYFCASVVAVGGFWLTLAMCGVVSGKEDKADNLATRLTQILADVGDLQVRFESRSFWTLYRIDYRGQRLCKDYFGSHYGTVVNFPGVGFIGSGHTENRETEQVLSLALEVNGRRVKQPQETYRCRRIRLIKQSQIRDLTLTTTITVRDNRIYEEVAMRALQPTKATVIYHFMHPWVDSMTEFLAVLVDGTKVAGAFDGDGKMKVDMPTRWSAVYEPTLGKGAVTYVLDVPEGKQWRTWYWDKPPSYRKHYLVTFQNDTVPAGEEFYYRIVTAPFTAELEEWKMKAQMVADMLRKIRADRVVRH